ncbi:DNA repair protein RAD51 homolog 3-like isoform X3 [Bufo gargarizans]|uniref:DNA repair protein RAD51 homolog 3-like isoform X3 n=1 Tax=Bufo gargarizans TaxID=30331 RepID=UPI001CF3A347|nr:DNA repair protein RAD51 homolog 3-like isoform X3 [Bufo gargarizans]
MQREVGSFPLAPSVRAKLIAAGFSTLQDVADVTAIELARGNPAIPGAIEAGLPEDSAVKVLQILRRENQSGTSVTLKHTALELLEQEQAQASIITFCSALDEVLGGGVPLAKVTEICGPPGVGKTQLCMQLAVDVQIPECFGGVDGETVYIDTENGFLVERLVDIANACVLHCSLITQAHQQDDQKIAMQMFTLNNILSKTHYFSCQNYAELLARIFVLSDFIAQHTKVVITNQMTTRIGSSESLLVPALGESWGHAATNRIILHWEGLQRFAALNKASNQKDVTVQFQITHKGFRDVQAVEPNSAKSEINPRKRLREHDKEYQP